jgi:hypothetical protein
LPGKQKQFALKVVSKRPVRIRRAAAPDPKARRKFVWIFTVSSLVLVTIFAFTWDWRQPVALKRYAPVVAKPTKKPFKAPRTLDELVAMTPEELDHCDIALMNLLCTQGLPGAENVNIPELLATLDEWAFHIRVETQRNIHHFFEHPEQFNNSEGYYRMMMFVTVIQQDYLVHYNPDLMDPTLPNEIFLADSKNIFIHGLIGPDRVGTCSSMPVLYVAIARRLGYPLYLAVTKNHFFAQWNDGKEHFNVEGTSWGFSDHSDDFYKNFPIQMTEEDLKQNRYLRPLTGAEELSEFLQNRGSILGIARNFQVALGCYEKARDLTPTWADVVKSTKELERIVANPILQGPEVTEIEHMNDVYRRTHGHYTPPLPAGAEDAPVPKMPRAEDWSPNDAVTQSLPNGVHVNLPTASIPHVGPNGEMVLTSVLPNGLNPETMRPDIPNPVPQQSRDAYDSWPNPRPGQQLPWLNPASLRPLP